MSDFLDRYTGRNPRQDAEGDRLADAEALDDLVSFGWLRGMRDRAIMLELRKKDGNILAVGYGWLERAEFDPSEGITLHLGAGRTIRIRGRNLNAEIRPSIKLFEGITRHRVSFIQEAGEPALMLPRPNETVVEAIEW